MQLRISCHPHSVTSIGAGVLYTRHGEELGDYFLDSLFADIDSLALYAGIHMLVWGFHRMLARRFRYAIYYRVDGDVCTVWRVLDCRQRPSRARR